MTKGKKNNETKGVVKKATPRKRTERKPRFAFVKPSFQSNAKEPIAKFLSGLKDIVKNSPEATEQFEILCINTIGYVQPVARELLFNLTIDKNEK